MRTQALLALATSVAALSGISPASAGGPTTIGANAGLAGFIAATIEESATVSGPGFRVAAQCKFAGVLTPSNTLVVEFAGSATATGPVNQTVPLLTAVKCEINNTSEGGTESQSRDIAFNGPAAAVADSTLLATSGPKEWPVKDITVCVTAFAIWGPTPVRIVTLASVCETPNG